MNAIVARRSALSWTRSPWYKSAVSLSIGLYAIYIASGLWPSVCKSRRDLYLVI